jgi:hypothetical protein
MRPLAEPPDDVVEVPRRYVEGVPTLTDVCGPSGNAAAEGLPGKSDDGAAEQRDEHGKIPSS